MKFSVLASGSSGNACYIETAHTRILIDAGLSGYELIRRLDLIGVKAEDLDALIITHEHADHVKGVGPLARRFNLPVYGNIPTLKRCSKTIGNISRPVAFHTGQVVPIHDLLIETFTKCHDSVDPMGLIISSDGIRLGLVTDLGRSTQLVEERLKVCQALILEFNHDVEMLDNGPYPLDLKRRIKGSEGHLSNEQAGELLRRVSHRDLRVVVLSHLSEVNNQMEKAHQEAKSVLTDCGLDQTRILASHQDHPSPLVELSKG